jgi:arginyl-tRNA synthetase
LKSVIKNLIDKVAAEILAENGIEAELPEYTVEIPNNKAHGDFAANTALKLSKALRKNPFDIATEIADKMKHPLIERCEPVRPGFVNFFVSKNFYTDFLRDCIQSDTAFRSNIGAGRTAMVEFVSANPTGPLHIGHGRNAAYGDSLSRILRAAGYNVMTEYYVNDAGKQMMNLGRSIYIRYLQICGKDVEFIEDGYKGEYIVDIAKELKNIHGETLLEKSEEEALNICFEYGLEEIRSGIESDLKEFRVSFDRWFSEKSLYTDGDVEACLAELRELGHVYDKDGAVWFNSTQFGDDKDRVVKRQNGEYTYFASDIAYHRNKYNRGARLCIEVWGADHHGYVKRLASAINSLGLSDLQFEVSLIQMVNLIKDGERASMSTRAGEFITMKWLIDEIGVDATRFFYLMRDFESQCDFDIDLAKKRTSENPVYYVQYAHARVYGLYAKAEEQGVKWEKGASLELLELDEEKEIIRKLYELKGVIETAASHHQPHRIIYWLQDLAAIFHSYYYNNVIISTDNPALTEARLGLCAGVASGLSFGLDLLGVNAPERM